MGNLPVRYPWCTYFFFGDAWLMKKLSVTRDLIENSAWCVMRNHFSFSLPSPCHLLCLSFPLTELKCCWLPGILGKHTKLINFFVLTNDPRNSRHFFSKLEAWCIVKTRACLLRFSALEIGKSGAEIRTHQWYRTMFLYVQNKLRHPDHVYISARMQAQLVGSRVDVVMFLERFLKNFHCTPVYMNKHPFSCIFVVVSLCKRYNVSGSKTRP